ncbi:DUF3040 domain-containing protein [Kitasatospora sp. NBC_01560]|uniref:hypothetical protein n=1 Tax=Kitasatospora sp. NBC_01560 TaxID=2975965 RepID=UPI00386A05AF
MDGPALSGRERRLLEEIESELRQDARLDRRLSTMGAKPPSRLRKVPRRLARKTPPGVLMTALVMSAICLSIGVRAPTTAALVTVALVWALSVAVSVGVAVLLRRRRPARPDAWDGPDHPGAGRPPREGRERGPRGEHGEPRGWDRPEA